MHTTTGTVALAYRIPIRFRADRPGMPATLLGGAFRRRGPLLAGFYA
jgi:hypothetical protein